jgi:pSer/pThr/pTyr-binding forkhead associated (FHA) protein
MDEIVVGLMSGPKDGDVLTFETLIGASTPLELTIGRREGCDVCLNYDSQVSREHALVIYDGEKFWLEDTGSTNGTFVDDERVEGRVEIRPGQMFRVGRTWLRIEPSLHLTPPDVGELPDDLPF